MTLRNNTSADEPDRLPPLTVTVSTAKRLSGLGHTTIWNLIKCGAIEVVRIRRRTLIVYRSLQELLTTGQPTIEAHPESGKNATKVSVNS